MRAYRTDRSAAVKCHMRAASCDHRDGGLCQLCTRGSTLHHIPRRDRLGEERRLGGEWKFQRELKILNTRRHCAPSANQPSSVTMAIGVDKMCTRLGQCQVNTFLLAIFCVYLLFDFLKSRFFLFCLYHSCME